MPSDKPIYKTEDKDLEKNLNTNNIEPNILPPEQILIEKNKNEKPISVPETITETETSPTIDKNGENFLEEAIGTLKGKLKTTKKPIVIPQVKDQTMIEIEQIMESDLKDAFLALTPIQKQEFKIKGEETAWKVREILKKTHVKVKNIFQLIFEWLKMLPGINKFFLEQEAKIKTDKILALHEIKKHQD